MSNTKIMGILNVTPDSCSETGKYFSHDAALVRAKEIIDSGVNIIDVGAESTRPGGGAVSISEEIRRLEILPEIKKLAHNVGVKVSLDSRNYDAVKQYINDIDIINDVSGFYDERMQDVALTHNKKVIFVHSLSVPVIKGQYIQTDDIILYLQNWCKERVDSLTKKGFSKEQLVFDPGIGFGTDVEQSFRIVKDVKELMKCGVEVLIGHSRKSFLASLGELDYNNRDPETHALTFYLASKGIGYVRVHDVTATARIIKMTTFIRF